MHPSYHPSDRAYLRMARGSSLQHTNTPSHRPIGPFHVLDIRDFVPLLFLMIRAYGLVSSSCRSRGALQNAFPKWHLAPSRTANRASGPSSPRVIGYHLAYNASLLVIGREVPLRFILDLLSLQIWRDDRVMHNMGSVNRIHWRHPIQASQHSSSRSSSYVRSLDLPVIQTQREILIKQIRILHRTAHGLFAHKRACVSHSRRDWK